MSLCQTAKLVISGLIFLTSRAKGAVVKAAAFGLGLIALALPFAAQSNESLVAKREACRLEARARIASQGRVGIDGFRRIVERRAAHVTQCMSRAVVTRIDPPLPPVRSLNDAPHGHRRVMTESVRKTSPRSVRNADQRKLKLSSIRMFKDKKRARLAGAGE